MTENHTGLRAVPLIRLLAQALPEFKGRNRLLLGLAEQLNPRWPANATFTSSDGIRYVLDLTDRGGYREFYLLGRFEIDLMWVLEHLVHPSDIVIEAGTGVGVYTVKAACRVGDGGCVHGFEPNPAAYHMTQHNLDLNQVTNAALNPSALSSQEGAATIYSFDNLPHGHASLSNLSPEHSTGQDCNVTTIDHYVLSQSMPKVNFIKLDVEGSELPALQGGLRTIQEMHPFVMVEANSETSLAFGYGPNDIIGWFRNLEYRCFFFHPGSWVETFAIPDTKQSRNLLFVWKNDTETLQEVDAKNT